MAFNYQTLKQYTGDAFIDQTLTGSKIAAGTVAQDDIATGAVDSNKLADGAVNLGSSVVTGTVPVSAGGTGLTSVGGNHTILSANSSGNALEYRNEGF